MIKVLDKLQLSKGTVLVCEIFNTSDVTDRIKTNIGIFEKENFYIDDIKNCFSEPHTRNIVIRKNIDCSKITELDFI
jgi:hypothetical protein